MATTDEALGAAGTGAAAATATSEEPTTAAPTLHEPADGVPDVCDSQDSLLEIVAAFAVGSGPVALDAERASGHRYGQRAFLIQAKRAGSGIALLDPEALADLRAFAEAIQDCEWVLHAATQDLACLAEVGMRPTRLFDTELAGRLLNLPRVGLASLTESMLGWHLAKGHSAADWSVRPLPRDYLRYAALDVELLLELRDILQERLQDAGKWEWAQQEFDSLLRWEPRTHQEPWRRTAGSHKINKRRNLAVLRALWQARESLAQQLDLAPGRVLQDSALVAAAEQLPASRTALLQVPGFKRQHRRSALWWQAIGEGLALPVDDLPTVRPESSDPPNPRSWSGKDPAAAARFDRARARVLAIARDHDLPAEILISPDTVRRLAWAPPTPISGESVSQFMSARGARPWQVGLLADALAEALDHNER